MLKFLQVPVLSNFAPVFDCQVDKFVVAHMAMKLNVVVCFR